MSKVARVIDVDTAIDALDRLGPVLRWTFDTSSALAARGALANDGVSVVRPGILGRGGAADFNGVTGYYAADSSEALRPDSGYSVSAWFEADRLKAGQTILSYAGKGNSNGLELEIGLKGSKLVLVLDGEDGKTVLSSAKGAVAVDTPHHVAVTLSGSTATLFLDGKAVSSGRIPASDGLADLPLVLGASNAKSSAETVDRPKGFFDGEIDDVAVYQRSLAAAEIKQLAGLTTATPPPPPAAPPPSPPPPPGPDNTIDILIVGDSLTVSNSPFIGGGKSFGTLLESFLESQGYDVDVTSISVSGYTINQGLNQLTGFFNNGGEVPDAAIVALGTNDRFQDVPTSSSEASLDSLLDLLDAKSVDPVLVAGAYGHWQPIFADPAEAADNKAFEAIFGRQASDHQAILYDQLLEAVVGDTAGLTVDSLHPNEAGTLRIIQDMLPELQQLLTEAK